MHIVDPKNFESVSNDSVSSHNSVFKFNLLYFACNLVNFQRKNQVKLKLTKELKVMCSRSIRFRFECVNWHSFVHIWSEFISKFHFNLFLSHGCPCSNCFFFISIKTASQMRAISLHMQKLFIYLNFARETMPRNGYFTKWRFINLIGFSFWILVHSFMASWHFDS